MIRVRVPATSANLGPGFDALGLALQLHFFVRFIALDAATVSGETGHSRVSVAGAGSDTLPRDESNITWQAARHLLRFAGRESTNFRLETENAIPFSRGLGSSAAARVGGLVAANEWVRQQGGPTATTGELLSLATQLEGHPDNAAAALLGGLVASVMEEKNGEERAARGENADADTDAINHATDSNTADSSAKVAASRVRVERFPTFLVWVPDDELATKKARAVLPQMVSRADAVFNVSRASLLIAALSGGELDLLRVALRDRLHQSYRSALIPGFDAVVRAATEAGAYGATLSGAGSSVLLWLPPDHADVVAATRHAIEDAAARQQVAGKLLSLPVDHEGCVVVPDDEGQ